VDRFRRDCGYQLRGPEIGRLRYQNPKFVIGKTNSLVEYAKTLATKEFGGTETLIEEPMAIAS
jgi:hypothetical protein